MERMHTLGPEFIDVTWNAGGRSSDLTAEIVSTAQSVYGLETVMHLTCTNMPKEKVDEALKVGYRCLVPSNLYSFTECKSIWMPEYPRIAR